jgi:hypothetical protein
MSRLLFKKAEVYDKNDNKRGTIENITVEGLEVSMTPETVVVENEREFFDAYTGRVVIRTLNTHTSEGTTANFKILEAGAGKIAAVTEHIHEYISCGGEDVKEAYIKLVGKGIDVTLGGSSGANLTFIQGYQSFENGRLETVLVAQLQDVDSRKVLFSEAGTA